MRIASHIILIISVLFFPWWLTALLLVAACLVVDRFYEAVVYGIVFDSMYASSFGFHGLHCLATLFSIIVLSLSIFLRKRLSW